VSKRDKGKFEPRPRDFYATPRKAVLPLIPHLRSSGIQTFAEPCCGEGDLVRHLESFGLACTYAGDIATGQDALAVRDYAAPDAIVTNPPFDTDNNRRLMHRLIRHFLHSGNVAWLLIDTDWLFTQQATPFLPACSDVVTIGRVKWFPGTPDQSTDNFAWYRFDAAHADGPRLHWLGRARQAALPLSLVHCHARQAAEARP
jgi:hypothetical protein